MKISNFKRNSVLACALLAGLSGEMLGMSSTDGSSGTERVPGGIPINYNQYLRDACKSQNVDLVKCLIEKGAELTTEFPLHSVVEYGDNVALFELFIGDTQKIKKEQVLSIADDTSKTILHVAASYGRIEILGHLFDKKNGYITDEKLTEALNKKDLHGCTPLHLAKNEAVVDILIKNGAKIDARNNNGQTPLQLAIKDGRMEVAKALINQKADVNAADNNGWTSLHYAAARKNNVVIELLIEHGASPHAKTWFLETPLSLAQGEKDTVKLLAKHTNIWLYQFTNWLNDAALVALGTLGTRALLRIDQKKRLAYLKKWVLSSALAVLVTHTLENVTRKNFSYRSYLQSEKIEKLACLAVGAMGNGLLNAN